MGFSKKSFISGMLIGFFVGSSMIFIVALGAGFLIIKDPHGPLAKLVINKLHLYSGVLGPLVSIKHLAESTASKLKTPELKMRYPFSFQTVSFPGSRVEQSQDLLSWISPFSDRIPVDQKPPEALIKTQGQSRAINLIGLKGETLSFQVVLRSQKNLDNIMITFVPDQISGISCIQVHRFKEIYLKVILNQEGSLKKIMNTDPLVPFTDPYKPGHILIDKIALSKNINQPVWIDIHFSENCPPGDYSGVLKVTKDGSDLRNSQIHFHIINASLPKDVGLDRWMQLYTGRFTGGEMIPNDQMFRLMLSRYYVMAHKYGFATGGCGTLSPAVQWKGKKIESVDWSKYDYLQGDEISGNLTGAPPNQWCFPLIGPDQVGVTGGFTYQTGTPSDISDWKKFARPIVKELSKAIVTHWKEKGWPLNKGFVYIWDEPEHQIYYPDIYKIIAYGSDAIHDASNRQLKVMLTDNPYTWSRLQIGHHKNVIYNKIDIWAANGSTLIPDRYDEAHKKGEKVWFYQSGPPFLGDQHITGFGPGFRMYFWTAWKYKINGIFYWASNFWSGNAETNNPYKHGGVQDGVMFYPGHQLHYLGLPDIDGPVPSVRMSQWRRGYEDYKYFVLLKEKGESSYVDKKVNALIIKALDDGGYIPYWRNPLWHRAGDWEHDPKVWHKTRVELANKIERIYAKP